jgi:hydroxyacylglutathione hydrolase
MKEKSMSVLEIIQIPALIDNYIYILHDPRTLVTAVVDPTLADPVLRVLESKNWTLSYILNTHHHGDHIGGNDKVREETGAQIIAPLSEKNRIPHISKFVKEGDRVMIGQEEIQIFEVPGHTTGHIAFWCPHSKALFCGDTLFALGCGRLFEGTAEEMWASLLKIKKLPLDTKIYCAHEYTLANAQFALSIDPFNRALQHQIEQFKALRSLGKSTIPTLLNDEIAGNPFLRADVPAIAESIGLSGYPPEQVFAELRKRKNTFFTN